jgi:hypothetical protein
MHAGRSLIVKRRLNPWMGDAAEPRISPCGPGPLRRLVQLAEIHSEHDARSGPLSKDNAGYHAYGNSKSKEDNVTDECPLLSCS